MKKDIILAGVGGQGILSIAATISIAAMDADLYLRQAEVHGMSQRGGAVQSHLRLSSENIFSDLITHGKADMIIAIEPMEALRYLNVLSKNGWVITNTNPVINISDYPDIDDILNEINKVPHHVALNADQIAKDLGSPRSANIVILGAASPHLAIDFSILENAVRKIFDKKGEKVVRLNLDALNAGKEFSQEYNNQ